MLITDLAIRNRTTVAVLGLIIILMGGYSYLSLPREAFPDIPIPHILVSTMYEGVSPEDIETSVTMKIEKELSGIRSVKEIRSSSAEGLSMIDVEFTPDVPTEVALQRVRDRVDMAKGELPRDAEDPVIKEVNFAEFPIMLVSISGDVSPVQFKEIADDLEDALETVPGVLKVEVLGALEPEIRLEFAADRVASYNLTIPEILALIPSENVNISAGGLETEGTKFNVRIPAEFVGPEEVDHLLLTVRDGKPIYLSDVATVRAAFKDRTSYSRLNGSSNVTLSIQKRAASGCGDVHRHLRHVQVHPQHGGRPGEQHPFGADSGDGRAAAIFGLATEHNRGDGHTAEHAHRLLPDPDAGLHVEHGRAIQPGAGSGYAGRQCHRHRGEHLPPHPARLQPH